MKDFKRGFDFNGVVDSGRPGLQPNPDDVIVTGNTFVEGVIDYLRDHDIKCAVYFPPDRRYGNKRLAVGVWKSEMIRRLQLDEFYEDDSLQADIIEESCPDTKIIRIT